MKSRRRRHRATPKRLQMGKSIEKRLHGEKRDAERKKHAKAYRQDIKYKRRTNRTNTLKARRRLQYRKPSLTFAIQRNIGG